MAGERHGHGMLCVNRPLFSRVWDLACTTKVESHAGDSVAAGRATHVGQISSEMPGKDRHTGPSGCGLVVGLTSSHRNIPAVSKPEQREGHGLKTIRSAKDEEEGRRG